METYYSENGLSVYNGDCLEVLLSLADNSVDSIVTDPPYGLKFMGKKWDYDVPSVEVWTECLRVLKPGGHLLAFAGTRTQHRMTVRIEDAGFEIRDMIAWVYGSGFPKSMDVSKAIDKAEGAEREVVGSGKGRTGKASQPNGGSTFSDDAYQWPGEYPITAPATDAARQWQGWGTALKPAMEPITVARKPLDGTVAANVLTHGTGALNIDGCRVGDEERINPPSGAPGANNYRLQGGDGRDVENARAYAERSKALPPTTVSGRWPANVIHDGSDEVEEVFPNNTIRFFYCAKASRSERGKNNTHPTVKPISLMVYLCKLVTPLNGTVLDPYMGSGTTLIATKKLGFKGVGIELNQEYCEMAVKRLGGGQGFDQLDLFPLGEKL